MRATGYRVGTRVLWGVHVGWFWRVEVGIVFGLLAILFKAQVVRALSHVSVHVPRASRDAPRGARAVRREPCVGSLHTHGNV